MRTWCPPRRPTPSNTPHRFQPCPRVTLGLRHHRRLRATAHSRQNSGIFLRRSIKPPGGPISACRILERATTRMGRGRRIEKQPTFGAFAGYKRIYSCTQFKAGLTASNENIHCRTRQVSTKPRDEFTSTQLATLLALLSPHSGSTLVGAIRAKGGR